MELRAALQVLGYLIHITVLHMNALQSPIDAQCFHQQLSSINLNNEQGQLLMVLGALHDNGGVCFESVKQHQPK